MKGAGKPKPMMGYRTPKPAMMSKVKVTSKAVSSQPACGHKGTKAGPTKGM